MYLKEFRIRNFRCIEKLDLSFHKGVNILIGENNSGKTSIIDGLRLCLGFGGQRRELYITRSDFFIDKSNPGRRADEISFDLHFEIENESEAVFYRELLNEEPGGVRDLQFHLRYWIGTNDRIQYKSWGGSHEGQAVSSSILQLINLVHLDALRDAEKHLKPFRDSKLARLYSGILIESDRVKDRETKKSLAQKVKDVLNGDGWKELISKGREKLNEHLSETTFEAKRQRLEISFTGMEFEDILHNLHIQLPVFGEEELAGNLENQAYFGINQNGLGYNNLIYIAAVLGDINQNQEMEPESYYSLLIEEPEAHLHPQLQTLLFNYLNKLNREQRFQVFVSSHSPTISAKADLDSLIILQSQSERVFALPIAQSELTETNRSFLHKFLDVTKAQLFFAHGVIFVEGISEALLLPTFSKMLGNEYFTEKAGIEVVNVNGVAFDHFAKLFNSDHEDHRLNNRSAIITDDDRAKIDDDISSRAENALALEGGLLRVFQGPVTFEYGLFAESEYNRTLLLELYKEFRPRTVIPLSEEISDYARNFADVVKRQDTKSELAHRLAVRLETDSIAFSNFAVPEYIKDAIKYVVQGD